MGLYINQKLKNAKHLESANIDPKEDSCLICCKNDLFIITLDWLP